MHDQARIGKHVAHHHRCNKTAVANGVTAFGRNEIVRVPGAQGSQQITREVSRDELVQHEIPIAPEPGERIRCGKAYRLNVQPFHSRRSSAARSTS